MIKGFSKLTREEKIELLGLTSRDKALLAESIVQNKELSNIVDELSENTLAHFPFPFGVAPNMLINGQSYIVPLVTEESSVVAAIAKAGGIWSQLGGFKTEVISTTKKGQVHFFWYGSKELLLKRFPALNDFVSLRLRPLTKSMRKRGGGITDMQLLDKTNELDNYFQLDFSFETVDAMGANFINTCLEEAGKSLKQFVMCDQKMDAEQLELNMAILSNYTPDSKVKAGLSCSLEKINHYGLKLGIDDYANKFTRAVQIANVNTARAVTHNKGIFNGIDAIALATGNDWRALEAGAHAYASKTGKYKSLSKAYIEDNNFNFKLEIPLAVGTVGGVTNLHPMAKLAMSMLNNPSAAELMQIMAAVGLASNFSAVNALISTGIQQGHMKMHLTNILIQLGANNEETEAAKNFFEDKTVSFSEVKQWLGQSQKS